MLACEGDAVYRPHWSSSIVECHRLERVDNTFAKEAVVTGVTLAGRCRKEESGALRDRVRGWTRLVVRGDLQDLLDPCGRHVRLVLVVRGEIAVLANDERRDSGRVGCRHRRSLHVTVQETRSCPTGPSALLYWICGR